VDQAVGKEGLDGLAAEAVHVERGAGDEVAQALDALGGADQAAGAAYVDLAVGARGFGAALGAGFGEDVGVECGVLLGFGGDADDLGDDVTGALEADAIADAHVEALDLVGIVQRGVGDDDAADGDRLQARNRG
jgi:hypothetical protein